MKKNALLSVYHKDGIIEFAKFLILHGYNIFASGGTHKHLTGAGVESTDVATLVGGGAILGHKVVTLSRELHAGLLADALTELAELEELNIPFINLVCVDLYPLKDTLDMPFVDESTVIGKTDIGGPTMISSAAKGRRIVICDPLDRQEVMDWIDMGEPAAEDFIRELAAKADFVVSKYRLLSADFHSKGTYTGTLGERTLGLRYGENAPQAPAYLVKTDTDDPLALHLFKIHTGKPSMINFTDVDRALITMTRFAAAITNAGEQCPYIAIGVKHGNACGASYNFTHESQAIIQMLRGNLKSIFGGTVMLNFNITAEHADLLINHGTNGRQRPLDVVVARSIDESAVEILKRKNDRCLIMTNENLQNLTLDNSIIRRQVRGGWIEQPSPVFILDLESSDIRRYGSSKYPMETEEFINQSHDILLAWAVCATSNSNTITIVKDGMLIGNGVGQQDRVEAAELAIKRATEAEHDIEGAVAVSDSFFPYPDAPEKLIDAGVGLVLATSGSVKDPVVIKLFEDRDCGLIHIPDSIGRGFSNH